MAHCDTIENPSVTRVDRAAGGVWVLETDNGVRIYVDLDNSRTMRVTDRHSVRARRQALDGVWLLGTLFGKAEVGRRASYGPGIMTATMTEPIRAIWPITRQEAAQMGADSH